MKINKYKGKTVLIIGTGTIYKIPHARMIKELGVDLVFITRKTTWEKQFSDEIYELDIKDGSNLRNLVKRIATEHKIDGIMTFWEPYTSKIANIAQMLKLPYQDTEYAPNARNKYKMRLLLEGKRYNPEFKLIKSKEDLVEAYEEIGKPSIIKPVEAAASANVLKITKDMTIGDVINLYEETVSNKYMVEELDINDEDIEQMLYEEFIDGNEFSVEGYVYNNKFYKAGILEKFKFQYDNTFHPTGDVSPPQSINEDKQSELFKVLEEIVGIFKLNNCLIHAEMKWSKGKPYFIELGARAIGMYGVEMIEKAYNINLIRVSVDICLGYKPGVKAFNKPHFSIAHIVNPDKNGVLKDLKYGSLAKPIEGAEVSTFTITHPGQKVVTPPLGFQHIGWILISAKDEKSGMKAFNECVKKTEIVIQ